MRAKSPSERPGFAAWPALLGAAVLGGVGLFAALRPSPRPPPTPRPAEARSAEGAREATSGDPAPAPAIVASSPTHAGATGDAPEDEPPATASEPPAIGPQKPPLTLDEKLDLTSRHIGVLERRAAALGEEIAAAEREEDGDLAEKKRVRLDRTRFGSPEAIVQARRLRRRSRRGSAAAAGARS